MARGRGIAQLITHLSHLSLLGWCYLGGSILISVITWKSSKKVLPLLIKHQARTCYPDFEWIVIPHGFPISGIIFLVMSFFLGYFCESENGDDIPFFCFMSLMLFAFCILPIFIWKANQKCFMKNNGALFVSRFALLGLYQRIVVDKNSIRSYIKKSKDYEEKIIEFSYNGGKKCKIKVLSYAQEGLDLLYDALGYDSNKSEV